MNLPAKTLERYESLRRDKQSHDHVLEGLEDKSLMAVIGAHQSGKSTIARHILRIAHAQGIDDIGEIGTYTTRNRKPDGGDPAHYMTADEGITAESLLDDYENDQLLNISLLPTGHFYATHKSSLQWKYNILPMLPDSVEMARGAIGTLHTAYIMPEAQWWQDQFDDSVSKGRLEETLTSIEYAMQPHPHFLRIVNRYDKSGLMPRRIGEKLLTILLQGEKWYQENTLPASMSEGFDTEAAKLYRAAQSMLESVETSYGQA